MRIFLVYRADSKIYRTALLRAALQTIQTRRRVDSGLLNGATVFTEPAAAAIVGLFVGRISPRASNQSGGAAIIVGSAVVTAGIAASVLPLLVIGGLIGGVGWGSSYSGTLRTLSPLAEPDQRAGLFAAVFTVAYLAFGVPVIIAGQLIPQFGLPSTAIGYCVAIVVVATAGLIAQAGVALRRMRSDAVEPRPDQGNGLAPGWSRRFTTQDECGDSMPPAGSERGLRGQKHRPFGR